MAFQTSAMHTLLKSGLLALFVALGGCAQNQASVSASDQRDSTLQDAQSKAIGRHARAPSQVQLGFGGNTRTEAATDTAEATVQATAGTSTARQIIRPLREVKTFLGTLPCTQPVANCIAMRTTLTVAPTGEWRSRSQPLDKTTGEAIGAPRYAQGCWEPLGTNPWRIALRSTDNATRATLTFTNDNVLRVDTYNDARPTLDYRLTRQQDIDGIHEIDASSDGRPAAAPINCQTQGERP